MVIKMNSKGVSRKVQRYLVIFGIFLECFKKIPRKFKGCFKCIMWLFEQCLMGVSSCKGVS